jgi:hypothetical protein
MSWEFWNWLWSFLASSGLIFGATYLLRDVIGSYLTRSVEHRFEKKLEAFKASIRDNEVELDQIRSFLVSARRERDSMIQSKRLEAAEVLLRARHVLSQLTMLIEYMKILNVGEIVKDGQNPKTAEFVDVLIKPLCVDEKIGLYREIEKTLPRLYLSSKTLAAFDVYEGIILQAAMMLKLLSVTLPIKSDLIKKGYLSQKIVEYVPSSKEGFDKWGEEYVYQWAAYFHDEILRTLRHEVSGNDEAVRDVESAERLAIESRRAQLNVRTILQQTGLPESLINPIDATEKKTAVFGKPNG